MEKDVLRKKYMIVRKEILDKKDKSFQICNKIIGTKEFKNANVVAVYSNNRNEVQTENIIKECFKLGKIVCLPKVLGDHLMSFYQFDFNEKLILSPFNIYEPQGLDEKLVDKNRIDLIIIPGICFDLKGARIGYGKGYYDYYLANTSIYKIGICFKEQLLTNEIIITNSHDIVMDKIITD